MRGRSLQLDGRIDAWAGHMSSRAAWRRLSPARCRRPAGIALAVGIIAFGGQGGAGHSVGHFPSYYPDEIRVDVVDPEAAARGLADETLHAYVGAVPKFTQPIPSHVKSVRSLGSFLVLSLDRASERFATAEDRCVTARSVTAVLGKESAGRFTFHPYPITPYHADYLHHVDRIEAAKGAVGTGPAQAAPTSVGARGGLAETIVQGRFGAAADRSDVVLQEVPVDDLIFTAGVRLDGWSGPPWAKEGWFHAYRLLSPALDDASRAEVDDIFEQLLHGELRGGL